MNKVNVFEAKAKLSEYIDRAAKGELVIICRHNEPVAELRALAGFRTEPRPLGPIPGRPTFTLPPSFFEPLPADELDLWDGGTADQELLKPPATTRRTVSRVAETKGQYGARRPARKRRQS